MNKSDMKDKVKAFWDNPSHDYDSFPGHGVNSPDEKDLWQRGMAELLGPDKNAKILDIGTGTGFLALLLAEMGYKVTGVDWAKTKIQKAKDKASALKIPVNFDLQDGENLSFPDESFDFVVSRHVIWTLVDPLTAARDWARVIKPGGKVITDIPYMGSLKGSHHFGEDVGRNMPYYYGAQPEKVIEMFKEAGLTNIDLLMLKDKNDQEREAILVHGEKG